MIKSVNLPKLLTLAVMCGTSLVTTAYAMIAEDPKPTKHLILKKNTGKLYWGDEEFDCSWGINGTIPSADKREGDGKTPEGIFPFRRVFYRPGMVDKIETCFTLQEITGGVGGDGWCDQPGDPHYNESVTLPYNAHLEELWRKDRLYDVVLTVGYNDSPVISEPPMGSAIFVHFGPDGSPTAGCVALKQLGALLKIIKEATPNSCLIVEPQEKK